MLLQKLFETKKIKLTRAALHAEDYDKDDGDDSDGNTDDDQTETLITESPIIELTKTATVTDNNSNGKVDIGDSIIYTIIAENKGNVNLSVVTVNDSSVFNSPSNSGVSYSMTIEPKFVSSSAGSAQGSLTIGETATYSATFIISSEAFLNEKGIRILKLGATFPVDSNITVSYTHLTLPTKRIV